MNLKEKKLSKLQKKELENELNKIYEDFKNRFCLSVCYCE